MQTHLLGVCFYALARAYYVEVRLQVSIGDFKVAGSPSTCTLMIFMFDMNVIEHVMNIINIPLTCHPHVIDPAGLHCCGGNLHECYLQV